jgi:hypothetical protein
MIDAADSPSLCSPQLNHLCGHRNRRDHGRRGRNLLRQLRRLRWLDPHPGRYGVLVQGKTKEVSNQPLYVNTASEKTEQTRQKSKSPKSIQTLNEMGQAVKLRKNGQGNGPVTGAMHGAYTQQARSSSAPPARCSSGPRDQSGFWTQPGD